MRVQAIVAHPTDAFDMVGGTLANHIEQGDEVQVCFIHSRVHEDAFRLADDIKRGDKSAEDQAIEDESEVHVQRTREACEILGIHDVSTIDHRGEVLVYNEQLVLATADRIAEFRPEILITHNPMENAAVTPHAVCGQVVLEGMRIAQGARAGKMPHRVAQLFFFCQAGQTCWTDAMVTNRFPTIMIDVSEHADKKVKALAKLEAQYYTPEMAAKIVEATSGMAAVHLCVTHAEQFQAYYPDVRKTLPLGDYLHKYSKESFEEGAARLKLIKVPQ